MAGYYRQRSKAGHRVTRPAMRAEPDVRAFRDFYARGGYCAGGEPVRKAEGGHLRDRSDDDKVSKESVDYSPGMGKRRCRNCVHYQLRSCELVRGSIDPSYWCEEFERAYAKGGTVNGYAGGGEIAKMLAKRIRPALEDIYDVASSYSPFARVVGRRTVPTESLVGGVGYEIGDQRRVDDLVRQMSSPEGYIRRLIAEKNGDVIEGQHRLDALRRLEVPQTPIHQIEDLSRPYNVDAILPVLSRLHPDQRNMMLREVFDAIRMHGENAGSVLEMPGSWNAPFQAGIDAALRNRKATGGSIADDLNLYQSQYYAGGGKVDLVRKILEKLRPAIFDRQEIIADPRYVYHATNHERLRDIAASGKLKTFHPYDFTDQMSWPDGGTERRAYFSYDPSISRNFAPEEGPAALLRILRTPSIKTERTTKDLFSRQPVSIDDIEYLHENGDWSPIKYAHGGSVNDDLNLYQSQYYAGGGAVKHLRNWMRVLAEGLDLPIGVRAPSEVVPKIIEDGRFKSQFETTSSQGAYDPEFRRKIEKDLFNTPEDIPDAQRPIYGSLFDPRNESSYGSARSYGRMMGVPKPEVKQRSTFTLGDSFGQSRSYPFVDQSRVRLSPKAENTQNLWQTMIRTGSGSGMHNPTEWSPIDFRQFWSLSPVRPYGYIEAQVHGGLPISDLSRWVWDADGKYDALGNIFHKGPEIADKTGVPVIARSDSDRPWHQFTPGGAGSDEMGHVLRKEDLGYAHGGSVDDDLLAYNSQYYAGGGGVDPEAGDSGIGAYDDTVGFAPGGLVKWLQRIAEPIKAWHGTPHAFDKFDASKIGTGEGAQVYGHGLYFAENPGVAKWYRESLAGKPEPWDIWYGDQPIWSKGITKHVPDEIVDAAVTLHPRLSIYKDPSDPALHQRIMGELERTLENARNARQENRPFFSKTLAEDLAEPNKRTWSSWDDNDYLSTERALNLLRDPKFRVTPGYTPGHLYEVNLHADPGSFLHWDKPFKEQSNLVQDILWDIWKGRGGNTEGRTLPPFAARPEAIGDDLHAALATSMGLRSPSMRDSELKAAAASALREEGVPGIRYLDQGSRRAGEGSHNYVVFPGAEDIVEIVNRYFLGGSVGDEE